MAAENVLSATTGALLIVPMAGYGGGIRRLRRHGVRWPAIRTAAFAGGLTCLAATFLPPVGTDDEVRVHLLQHLLIAMVAPLLLALSAPVTLALRALPRQQRFGLLRLLHSRWLAAGTQPVLVLAVEVGGMYALYLSPLHEETETHLWLHLLSHVHLIITGCLFTWMTIGRDPMPRRLSTRGRLLLLVAAAGSHDVLAKLMYADARPRGAGSIADLRAGAELLYYGGDVLEICLAVGVLTTWYARGGRELRRADRRGLRHTASTAAQRGGPAAGRLDPVTEVSSA